VALSSCQILFNTGRVVFRALRIARYPAVGLSTSALLSDREDYGHAQARDPVWNPSRPNLSGYHVGIRKHGHRGLLQIDPDRPSTNGIPRAVR
jgi:hypothetical protein